MIKVKNRYKVNTKSSRFREVNTQLSISRDLYRIVEIKSSYMRKKSNLLSFACGYIAIAISLCFTSVFFHQFLENRINTYTLMCLYAISFESEKIILRHAHVIRYIT